MSTLPLTSVPTGLAPSLAPPLQLEQGSIVTVRMPGHVRSPNHAEYFAPAVVLADSPGETAALLVLDPSAGTHYAHAYQKRELSNRGVGSERETYEVKSNIGEVLYSPVQFAQLTDLVCELQARVQTLQQLIDGLTAPVVPSNIDTTNSDSGTAKPSKKQ